ncbi:MAG: PKD domain-containing protein [Bacteroidota bacterium]
MPNTKTHSPSTFTAILLLLSLLFSSTTDLLGQSCQALFDHKVYEGALPGIGGITFTNESTGNYSDLSWDFGDGNVSSFQSAVVDHFYASPGNYEVCLSIWDGGECSSQSCETIQVSFINGACLQDECVLPGDANLDGAANFYDMIIIGMGFGTNGPPRPNATLDFTPQPADDWPETTPTGINYKHLDCDGNGTIGVADLLAIVKNYEAMQSAVTSAETEGPPIYVQFDVDTIWIDENIREDMQVTAGIMVGDQKYPAEDFHGMALHLTYDTTYVKAQSVNIEYNESSFFGNDRQTVPYGLDLRDEQQIDLAFTRIDGGESSGFGRIATASFIIIHDILDGRSEPTETATFDLPIGGVRVLDSHGDEIPVVLRSVASKIVFAKRLLTSVNNPELATKIDIFPNPVSDQLRVNLSDIEATHVELFNVYGQQIMQLPFSGTNLEIGVGHLPRGLYLLNVHTSKGMLSKQVILK